MGFASNRSLALIVALSWPALAAAVTGERHYVAGGFAVVRESPYGGAAAVATIREGQEVLELARQRNWIQVGVVRRAITGWIHRSFLVQGGVPGRTTPLIPPMRRFKPAFDAFNALRGEEDGAPPFTSVHDRENGILWIGATSAWWMKAPARRQQDLTSLYQMWKVANEQLPVTVLISDPQQRRRLKRTDSNTAVVEP